MKKVLLTLSIMVFSGSLSLKKVQRLQKPRAYRSSRGQRSRWRAGSRLLGGRQTIPAARPSIIDRHMSTYRQTQAMRSRKSFSHANCKFIDVKKPCLLRNGIAVLRNGK
jgi:hypothetical protein